jgi:nucleoside-diphosphate-sugar epimerase
MRITIVGHKGYIGSFLYKNLSSVSDYDVQKGPESREQSVDVSESDVVIYLGGLVGHEKCAPKNKTAREVFDENVGHVMGVAYAMKPGALLIYSSTAALYDGFGTTEPSETVLLYETMFDQYTYSMFCRENNLKTLTHIRTIGLRLGTVIGIADVQKKTSIHIKMLRDAVLHGKIDVKGAHLGRSILWNRDLQVVFDKIIERNAEYKGHTIYNVASFNCTVAKIANEIGCKTGCNVVYREDDELTKRSLGFSMSNEFVKKELGVEFKGNNAVLMDELIANIKHVCYCDTYLKPVQDDAKCRVCKGSHMAVLYDFGTQPNANHYLPSAEGALEEYPLRLDLCKNCYHTQLSYTLPPEQVFSDYIYLSGTSNTMREFFRDFAERTVEGRAEGTVLEIACNDGSLLDFYREKGWKTYGYDPARNIYEISSKKGHEVTVGFWGPDPVPDYPELDLIVAQNVCAHVPDPVAFLAKCREVMTDRTVLYIQTSQSEMIEKGQFDTAYHEHLSFFTVRSMDVAAKMAGLCLDGVEKVDVHGSSYVFRLRLQSSLDITTHPIYQYEKEIGLYDDLLYYVYVEKVNGLRDWLTMEVANFERDGISIAGYGAAAKGMTILNFMPKIPMQFIADDSKCKQEFYATNHKYLITAPPAISRESGPLAVIVFAWNFIEEIKSRVKKLREGSPTYFLVPYPKRAVFYVSAEGKDYTLYEEMDTRFNRDSIYHNNILISHFYNEEALLTQWIRHHAPLFNCAVLIDNYSDDNSLKIIKREAPESWNVVKTAGHFCPHFNDWEVSGYENSFDNHHWRLTLTTTEFLNTVGIRRKENRMYDHMGDLRAVRIPCLSVIDGSENVKNEKSLSLIQQKNDFYFQNNESKVLTEDEERYINNHYNRFMHNIRDFTSPYCLGRHNFKYGYKTQNTHILKYLYAPFPDFYSRKLQVKNKLAQSSKDLKLGFQHMIEYEDLERDFERKKNLSLINMTNISRQVQYFDKYMRDHGPKDQILSGLYFNMYDIKTKSWKITI